jgi:osmotically-inducible protein OsmY
MNPTEQLDASKNLALDPRPKANTSNAAQAVPSRRAKVPRVLAAVLGSVALLGSMSACAPLLIGSAVVGGALVANDRRTTGTQVEDQAIELKVGNRAREVSAAGHINATSYNRLVLLTGEVPTETDRKAVEQVASRVENVRSVVNELAIAGNTSLAQRSNDSVTSGRVKAALVDAKDLQATAIKVVTERGIVHLMGLVSEREATRAAEVARAISGVQRVVRVFEVISEAELAAMQPKPAPK